MRLRNIVHSDSVKAGYFYKMQPQFTLLNWVGHKGYHGLDNLYRRQFVSLGVVQELIGTVYLAANSPVVQLVEYGIQREFTSISPRQDSFCQSYLDSLQEPEKEDQV